MSTFTQHIDASCEAEGLAAERLAALLGTAVPQTHFQIVLGQYRAAAALGLPAPVKMPGYQWTASCEAHRRIANASRKLLVWGPPSSKRVPGGGPDERRRQAEKRLKRAALLVQLRYLPGRQALDLRTAATMAGIGQRTLERAVQSGRVGERVGKQRVIRASELRRLLASKLQGRPIAA